MEDDRKAGKLAKGSGSNQYQVRVESGPAAPTFADQGIDKHLADECAQASAYSLGGEYADAGAGT